MILATALTLASVGSQLLGTGMSFAEARKQKKIKADAQAAADKAMASARKSLEVNYMDSLAIQKEPYELERDASLVAGAQATEALRESERGAGRVGAIYGQQQLAQRQTAAAMGQEMFNLDYLSTQEDTRLRDLNTQLDLGEVTGAQLEAANSEERRAQQLMRGAQGIGNAAATGLDALNLYPQGFQGARTTASPEVGTTGLTQNQRLASNNLGIDTGFDVTGGNGFADWLRGQGQADRTGVNGLDPFALTNRQTQLF
jgi:hypothetical protein